ncbi:MAG: phosphatase PAP2 family protein [Actinobacteria bacterium]|nr:phosphatase PAP2 family protein [Actinomycetota bacterium]
MTTGRAIDAFDSLVDGWFDHLRGRRVPDRVFEVASHLGDFGLVWLIVATARGLGSDADPDRVPRLVAIFAAESLIVNQGVKRLFRRRRPSERPDVAERLREPLTSSFPSGHASSAACAAVILTDGDPAIRALVWPVAAIVATSRIHTRMHHPSDVVAGAAVGYAIGRAAQRFWPDPHVRHGNS